MAIQLIYLQICILIAAVVILYSPVDGATTRAPSKTPSARPTATPSRSPTTKPSAKPSSSPTTYAPTTEPTFEPTPRPSRTPTYNPTSKDFTPVKGGKEAGITLFCLIFGGAMVIAFVHLYQNRKAADESTEPDNKEIATEDERMDIKISDESNRETNDNNIIDNEKRKYSKFLNDNENIDVRSNSWDEVDVGIGPGDAVGTRVSNPLQDMDMSQFGEFGGDGL